MPTATELPDGNMDVAARVAELLAALGVQSAHIGTSMPMEIAGVLANQLEAVASLTLLNVSRYPPGVLSGIAERLLVFSGDSGLGGTAMQIIRPSIADAELIEFRDYPAMVWSDMAADHGDRIASTMLDFLARRDIVQPATRISENGRSGEAGGITFQITGEGPALLLFPAMLAPSQWNPLIDRLAEDFTVIRLGGPHLGIVALLEGRGNDTSYRRLVANMLDAANFGPEDRLLEIGCGSGVIARWLVREGMCATPATGVDLNPFLLDEANSLAASEGIASDIEFQVGSAEDLPLPDDSFDAALSVTLIEECNADRAIAEMVRVVRPGGRVAVAVRACDMPVFWNLPLDPAIKAKVDVPIRQVAPDGCADASLMGRMHASGLVDVAAYATFYGGVTMEAYFEPVALAALNPDEIAAWQAAKATAVAEGTFFMMHPVHCAVGTKAR
jgi:SAM-dependent methyltransferase